MVTILDIGLIQAFDFVFPVLLVWAIVFAVLQKTEVVGKSVGINALIASIAGLTVLLSRTVIDMINFMIPWFSIAIIFFILTLLLFMIFGAKAEDAYKDKALQWVLIAVVILIVAAAAGKVLGQTLLEQAGQVGEEGAGGEGGSGVATSSLTQNLFATLYNPKVLGLIVIFVIVVFAVALLTSG